MLKGTVRLLKISTKPILADMVTKVVPAAKFNLCLSLVGIYNFLVAVKVVEES